MNAMKTAKAKTEAPSAALAPEAAVAGQSRGRYDDILALQRAAGNRAVNEVLQGGYEITLTIGSNRIKLRAATKDEVIRSLGIAKQRLYSEVRDGLESQKEICKGEEENAFAAWIVSRFGRRDISDTSIWNVALAALDRSNSEFARLKVEFTEQKFDKTVAQLKQAADAITAAKRKLYKYREGIIESTQNVITGLEVAKVAGGIAVGVLTAGSGTAIATAAAVGYGAAQQIGEQGSKVYHGLAREIDWEGIIVDALISAGIGKLTTGVTRFTRGNVIPKEELEKNIRAFAIKAAKNLFSTQTVKDVIIGKLLSMLQLIIKAGYDTARDRTGGKGLKEVLVEQFSALLFDEKGDVAFQRIFFQTLGEAIGSATSRAAVVPKGPHPRQGTTEAKMPNAAATPEPATVLKPSTAKAQPKLATAETKVATTPERQAKAAIAATAETLPPVKQTRTGGAEVGEQGKSIAQIRQVAPKTETKKPAFGEASIENGGVVATSRRIASGKRKGELVTEYYKKAKVPVPEKVSRPLASDKPLSLSLGEQLERRQTLLVPTSGKEAKRALAMTEKDLGGGVKRRRSTVSGESFKPTRPTVDVPRQTILNHIYELEQSGALSRSNAKRIRMDEGKQLAVHAEIKQSISAPNEPVTVNRDMCDSCRNYFVAEAKFRGQVQIVADRSYVHEFRPNGSVREYARGGKSPIVEYNLPHSAGPKK